MRDIKLDALRQLAREAELMHENSFGRSISLIDNKDLSVVEEPRHFFSLKSISF